MARIPPTTDSTTLTVLQKALDASALRQEVIANNIANVDTPGYKAYEVKFEELLKEALGESPRLALKTTRPRHISGISSLSTVASEVVRQDGGSVRADGNNVDIDLESAKLAENQVMYSALTQLVNAKFSVLKYVISEGKR